MSELSVSQTIPSSATPTREALPSVPVKIGDWVVARRASTDQPGYWPVQKVLRLTPKSYYARVSRHSARETRENLSGVLRTFDTVEAAAAFVEPLTALWERQTRIITDAAHAKRAAMLPFDQAISAAREAREAAIEAALNPATPTPSDGGEAVMPLTAQAEQQ